MNLSYCQDKKIQVNKFKLFLIYFAYILIANFLEIIYTQFTSQDSIFQNIHDFICYKVFIF